MTYEEAVEYILEIPRFTKKHSLKYTKEFMKSLGNPQKDARIIHVAGTNGKGSVCAYLSSLIQAAGKSVGMFTSPHLVSIRERFRINGRCIDSVTFLKAFEQVYSAAQEREEHPTFFEFLFLMSLCIFKQADVDYWIMETGLGGRLDATNAVERPVLSVLTSVSLDHMEYLGHTVEAIAAEKAGIIKENIPVVYWSEDEKVRQVVHEKALQCNSREFPVAKRNVKILQIAEKHIDFSLLCGYYCSIGFSIPVSAVYQAENAAIAVTAFSVLFEKQEVPAGIIQQGLSQMEWQGRMEEASAGIFLDGAHNEAGIKAFLESAEHICSKRRPGKVYLLCSIVQDKDREQMEHLLLEKRLFDRIYIADMKTDRSCHADSLAEEMRQRTDAEIYTFSGVKEAFCRARADKKENELLFCAGSLYLIGEIKELLGQ